MSRLRNLAALGYAAFAIILWLSSMGAAGWFGPPAAGVAQLACEPVDATLLERLAVAMAVLMALAGLAQWWGRSSLDATLFLAFAAFWWVAGDASAVPGAPAAGAMGPSAPLGWYYIAWAVLAFCIWLAACRRDIARMLFALGLCASLCAYALANWLGMATFTVLGGYLGLVTAILGIYVAGALLLNEARARILLPLGEPGMRNGQRAADD